MTRRRRCALAAVLTLAAAGMTSVATAPAGAAPSVAPAATGLAWSPCGAFQCATLPVPVDYAQPVGRTFRLALIRRTADDPKHRIGTLVVNPGGPGASGVDYVRSIAETYPTTVRRRFDIVSFDVRGSGESDPVTCAPNIDTLFDVPFSPRDADGRAALVDAARRVASGCAQRSGAELAHVSTQETARDLDQLRAALGLRTLSFLGGSYGTYLGTLYASMFPDRVRAFVLDGAIDPAEDAVATTLGQARGFEQVLDDFLADCSARAACAFHHHGHAAAEYDALRARVTDHPLAAPGGDGPALDQTRFDAAVVEAIYRGPSYWPALAGDLVATGRGDPKPLLELAHAFEGSADGGAGSLASFWAISCLDGPPAPDVVGAARLEAQAAAVAPRLGAFVANASLICSVWPVQPIAPPGRLDAAGAPPILVIGNTRDPATPLAAARALTAELQRARLLVVASDGHTAFATGNGCVDRVVTRYLVARVLPRPGTRC